MKKHFFIIIIIQYFFINNAISQNCTLTNNISLNTGCDYNTNLPLTIGTPDPNWIILNANNIPSAINNTNAIVCNPNGGGASNPNSAWIGFATSSQYVTNNATIGFYNITFKYTFKTCYSDSLHFNLNMSIDNYISAVRIDGVPIGFSQAVSLVSSNWQTFAPYTYSNYFNSGTHTIEIDGQNFNVQNAVNPHLLNVFGNISSNNNSIVTFQSPINCICSSDSVNANFSFTYPNNCDSSIIQFTDLSAATNSTITNWDWYFGDGNSSTLQNPIHTYTGSGPFQVYLIVTSNTNKKDTFNLTVLSIENSPSINIIANPTSLCFGTPTTLTASGTQTYSWSNGITNGVSFIPTSTNTYTVTGTDANGCTSTSTITVQVASSLPIGITNTAPLLCIGDSSILAAVGGAISYSWSPSNGLNNTNSAMVYANPLSVITYTVVGTDANGCTGSATTLVDVIQPINISVSKTNDIECGKKNTTLNAFGAQNYSWTPSNFLSNPNSNSTTAAVTQTTTFYVTGTTGTCTDIDSITVDYFNSDGGTIFIPTAFSPNDDGLNDCLKIISTTNFKEFYFAIYNRWGQRVFESSMPEICWTGQFNGQPAPIDTYYYFLKAKSSCGDILKKGDITLVR